MVENNNEVAVLGGGCFWCIEAVFNMIEGVESVISGYAGGHKANPTYYEVCSGQTGHAEVVRVEFDPEKVTFPEVLEVFFASHDPTTLNRQGHDVGTQYRSVILCDSENQQAQAAGLHQGAGRVRHGKRAGGYRDCPPGRFLSGGTGASPLLPAQPGQHVLPDSNRPQGFQGPPKVRQQIAVGWLAAQRC